MPNHTSRKNNFTLIALGILLLSGLTLAFWHNFNQNKQTSQDIAIQDAKNFAYSVAQFRNFYTQKILPPLREKSIQITHDYKNIHGSVPLPATFAKDFGDYLSSQDESYQVRVYSDLPFEWRMQDGLGGPRDQFEKDAMEAAKENPDIPFWRFEERNGQTLLRYSVPDKLREGCVSCHNSYPGTPKTDWKVGDVRGVLTVTRPISDMNQKIEESARNTFFIMVLVAITTLLLLGIMLKRLRKTLEESEKLVFEKTSINTKLNEEILHRDKLTTELEVAKNKALESSKLKSEFLANMSHEIRTPMNGIIGMTGLLRETELNAHQRDLADTVCDSAESLLFIINDILDFSKIEAGKLAIEPKPFELQNLVHAIFRLLEGKIAGKDIALAYEIDQRLPNFVSTDEMRIRQILLNLLGNAIKFTPHGTVTLFITWANDDKTHLKFSVQDTGIGIPEAAKQRLFEAFSQVDGSTTRLYGGTGLGLTISKQLSALMGGEIGFESQEGVGSTFWFTVETQAFDEKDIDLGAKEKRFIEDGDISDASDELAILLVEDNLVNQKLAMALLGKLGYSAEIANNGQEAVDKLKAQPFDLVLMDCQMPIKDGYQATEEIRQFDEAIKDIPIIAMTANAMQGDDEKCYAAGMNDYLSKPVNPKVLAEKLEFWRAKINK